MRLEWWLLLFVYIVATAILLFIPKNKRRIAAVAFLAQQAITFLIGLVVVEWGLLEYPVRVFASINRTSFTYEYYAFPTISAAFNAWYPHERSYLIQLCYYVGVTTVLTQGEVLIKNYTNLVHYIHWEWYISWITICLALFLVRLFCVWFFAKK